MHVYIHILACLLNMCIFYALFYIYVYTQTQRKKCQSLSKSTERQSVIRSVHSTEKKNLSITKYEVISRICAISLLLPH